MYKNTPSKSTEKNTFRHPARIPPSIRVVLAFMLAALSVASFAQIRDLGLEPPQTSYIDRNNVNMANGTVSYSLTNVSIGSGSLSLAHTISSSNYSDFMGYRENFHGIVYKTRMYPWPGADYDRGFDVLRANSGDSVSTFRIQSNGTYTQMDDLQATLISTGGTYLLTRGDGTEVTFIQSSSEAHSTAHMSKIVYPNGFTVNIHRESSNIDPSNKHNGKILSVTTNNGLQLKYRYIDNPVSDRSLKWSRNMPKHIMAINNGVESCDPYAASCNLSHNWPQSTFHWPNGMPNVMRQSPTVFKVTDAGGRTTEYHHVNFNTRLAGEQPYYVGRIVKVKHAANEDNVFSIQYEYKNIEGWTSSGSGVGITPNQKVVKQAAVLYKALVDGEEWKYNFSDELAAQYPPSVIYTSQGFDSVDKVTIDKGQFGVPLQIKHDDIVIRKARSFTNEVLGYSKGGIGYSYKYDARNNVIKRAQGPQGEIFHEAGYDASCSNSKTCNQPNWSTDGEGNRTEYEYHPQSGQLAKITYPADKHGIQPQTRYTYAERYANYYQADGNLSQASTGIWLVNTESYCQHSSYTNDRCAAGDEIITAYEYDERNLFMIGKAVRDVKRNETLRTCYRYDAYGNLIGETQPKAGKTSCRY